MDLAMLKSAGLMYISSDDGLDGDRRGSGGSCCNVRVRVGRIRFDA
jgi:hypothetical protein